MEIFEKKNIFFKNISKTASLRSSFWEVGQNTFKSFFRDGGMREVQRKGGESIKLPLGVTESRFWSHTPRNPEGCGGLRPLRGDRRIRGGKLLNTLRLELWIRTWI